MTTPIEVLQEEHRNMRDLLDVLEREIDAFAAGETPDYDVVRGIAGYFLDYPDLCHHPKENVVYDRLKERDPAAAALVGDLTREHIEEGARIRRLSAAIEGLLEGEDIARAAIVAATREFIVAERHHMEMEERNLFPAALSVLTPADWVELGVRLAWRRDPLVEPEAEDKYATLRNSLLRWERESHRT